MKVLTKPKLRLEVFVTKSRLTVFDVYMLIVIFSELFHKDFISSNMQSIPKLSHTAIFLILSNKGSSWMGVAAEILN